MALGHGLWILMLLNWGFFLSEMFGEDVICENHYIIELFL